MRKIKLPLMLLIILGALISMCSCSSAEHTEELMTQIRASLISAGKITTVANIRADYTDRAFDFQIKFSGTEAAGDIALIEPSSLAGVTVHVYDNGATLKYDGAEIETGDLGEGLSPVGIIPMLINEWKNGITDFTYKEKRGSRGTLTLSSTLPNGATQKTWFEEKSGLPIRAEVNSSGRTVLAIVFNNVIYE